MNFLLKSADPLLIELYSKIRGKGLRPKTIVCYDREAFVYAPGNVRITLDRNLYTGLGSIDFLNTEIKGIKAMDSSRVLEVKYDEFLPDLVRMGLYRYRDARQGPARNMPFAGGLTDPGERGVFFIMTFSGYL